MTGTKSLDVLIESLVLALTLTVISYYVSYTFKWIDPNNLNLFEFAGLFTAYAGTWMCVRQTRWNYPMNLLNVCILAYFFWDQKIYGLVATNLYLIPWLAFGWWRWRADDNTRPVSSVFHDKAQWWAAYIIAAVVAFFSMRYITYLYDPDNWDRWQDSAIFAATIIAQFWLDNKKLETWAVWIFVNVLSIYLFLLTDQFNFAIQYALFLVNTLAGLYAWIKQPKGLAAT